MKKLPVFLALLAVVAFTACKNNTKKDTEKDTETNMVEEKKEMTQEEVMKRVSFTMESKSGSNATGKVMITEQNGMVNLQANLTGLESGTHAIHIHEKADCTAEDGTSSGGHWNPTFEQHGKWGDEAGYHKGDIGNFEADEEGNATVTFSTKEWCLGCGDEKKDIMGKAIIVHKGADDFTSQPSGAAGARVSCGGIIE